MLHEKTSRLLFAVRACVLLSGGAMLTLPAWAVDVAVSGFIRQEAAYKYSNKENELNRYGSKFNGKSYTLDGALTGTPILPIPGRSDRLQGRGPVQGQ